METKTEIALWEEPQAEQEIAIPVRNYPRDRSIMLRYLEGQAIPDIARETYLTEAQVNSILKQKHIRREMQRLAELDNQRHFAHRVESLAEEALDTARATMRGEGVSELRWKAAKDLLDRHPSMRKEAQRGGEMTELGESIIMALAKLKAGELAPKPPVEEEAQVVEEHEDVGSNTGAGVSIERGTESGDQSV